MERSPYGWHQRPHSLNGIGLTVLAPRITMNWHYESNPCLAQLAPGLDCGLASVDDRWQGLKCNAFYLYHCIFIDSPMLRFKALSIFKKSLMPPRYCPWVRGCIVWCQWLLGRRLWPTAVIHAFTWLYGCRKICFPLLGGTSFGRLGWVVTGLLDSTVHGYDP